MKIFKHSSRITLLVYALGETGKHEATILNYCEVSELKLALSVFCSFLICCAFICDDEDDDDGYRVKCFMHTNYFVMTMAFQVSSMLLFMYAWHSFSFPILLLLTFYLVFKF